MPSKLGVSREMRGSIICSTCCTNKTLAFWVCKALSARPTDQLTAICLPCLCLLQLILLPFQLLKASIQSNVAYPSSLHKCCCIYTCKGVPFPLLPSIYEGLLHHSIHGAEIICTRSLVNTWMADSERLRTPRLARETFPGNISISDWRSWKQFGRSRQWERW